MSSSTCPRSYGRYVYSDFGLENVSSNLRRHDLRVLDRMVDMFIETLVYRMCPLRRHHLRVLDRMVYMFIQTLV